MSLKIIKTGILDSIQDTGRYGYQRLGINPTGAMDIHSCRQANLLVGNPENDAVIELHFPASSFFFEQAAVMALTGADFSASIDHRFIPMNTPVNIPENSMLQFTHPRYGARCYMALMGGFEMKDWLGSYSTNFKAEIGGYKGRRLMKDDVLKFRNKNIFFHRDAMHSVSTKKNTLDIPNNILILPGPEWDWLSETDQSKFLNNEFIISRQSDRMGYRLDGQRIFSKKKEELVSSAVTFGTIQLLPDGSLILLMADHQTTGGYPRIATVITACHSSIAQSKPGDHIRFNQTDIETAERLLMKQEEGLKMINERM